MVRDNPYIHRYGEQSMYMPIFMVKDNPYIHRYGERQFTCPTPSKELCNRTCNTSNKS